MKITLLEIYVNPEGMTIETEMRTPSDTMINRIKPLADAIALIFRDEIENLLSVEMEDE